VERLCSSFGVALRYIGGHAPREANLSMVSRDWAEQHIHECIVGCPCRFCPALNLGLRAIRANAALAQRGKNNSTNLGEFCRTRTELCRMEQGQNSAARFVHLRQRTHA
jgi:hypothetical protein